MRFINIFFWHQFYTLIHSSSLKKLNSLSLKCILRVREAEVLTDPYWFSVSPKWKKILTFYTGKTRGVSASWREAWNQAVLNLPVCLETKLNARCWFWNNYSKLIDLLTGCVLQWMLSVCSANVRPFPSPCASFPLPCRMHVSWHEGSSFLHKGHHKLLERSQLERVTKVPSGVRRAIAHFFPFFKEKMELQILWGVRKSWSGIT